MVAHIAGSRLHAALFPEMVTVLAIGREDSMQSCAATNSVQLDCLLLPKPLGLQCRHKTGFAGSQGREDSRPIFALERGKH